MIYGFTINDRWSRPSTVVSAADTMDEFTQWTCEHLKERSSADGYYDECRTVSFREKMQDSRFAGFRGSIYEVAHYSLEQQTKFIERHSIKIVSRDVACEIHDQMVQRDRQQVDEDDDRTIGEIVSNRRSYDETPAETPVGSSQTPVNSPPPEILTMSRDDILNTYPSTTLPPHSFNLGELADIAAQSVSPSGWYHFTDHFAAAFRYPGDEHKFLTRLRQTQQEKFKKNKEGIFALNAMSATAERKLLPPTIGRLFSDDYVPCIIYPDSAKFGKFAVIPSPSIIQTVNLSELLVNSLDGMRVSVYGVSDGTSLGYVVTQQAEGRRLMIIMP